ncbi:GTP-binding protein, partial [Klebsiella pneumoniae]|nr:GTP-binding protein [Klebsiella pneumoniae]
MGAQQTKHPISIGLLAHVDAGKTTLSEALLFRSGVKRQLGRVDHGDAFLDTYSLERQRGITIFSKQALLSTDNLD